MISTSLPVDEQLLALRLLQIKVAQCCKVWTAQRLDGLVMYPGWHLAAWSEEHDLHQSRQASNVHSAMKGFIAEVEVGEQGQLQFFAWNKARCFRWNTNPQNLQCRQAAQAYGFTGARIIPWIQLQMEMRAAPMP